MITAGHHTMMAPSIPTTFKYIGIKFIAHRRLRYYQSLASYRATSGGQYDQTMFQFSRVEFIDSSGNYKAYPSGMQLQLFFAYNGRTTMTHPFTQSASNGNLACIFDHSTSTKWCVQDWRGNGIPALTDVYDSFDTNYSAPEADRPYAYNLRSTYTVDYYNSVFGAINRPAPICIVINLSSSPLDISVHSRWQYYTANDTASAAAGSGQRQWIEGEILGSNDMKTWWRLNVFNDIDMPTTNYAVAYTGNLIPRKGDIWSDLDLSTRDWANGISVDSVGGV